MCDAGRVAYEARLTGGDTKSIRQGSWGAGRATRPGFSLTHPLTLSLTLHIQRPLSLSPVADVRRLSRGSHLRADAGQNRARQANASA